jgi:hypothetical protein
VAGDEGGVVAERPELRDDSVEQRLMVRHREVRAADRALEQDIPHQSQL